MRDSADSDDYGVTRRGRKRGKFDDSRLPLNEARPAHTCLTWPICVSSDTQGPRSCMEIGANGGRPSRPANRAKPSPGGIIDV
jgi:hypothetical protein